MPGEVHLHPHSANVHRAAAVNPLGTDAPGAKSTVAPYRPDCTPTGAVGHPKGLPAHARPAPVFARANAVASDLHARRRRLRRRAAVAGVAASVLVIAGVAVPNLLRSNLNRNEAFAIAALKNISSAQAQFQASGIADPDGDGQGRYGFFAEMAGKRSVRTSEGRDAFCDPAVLSAFFGQADRGLVHRGGYVFLMLLPAKDGGWVAEHEVGTGRQLDPAWSSTLWLCYAWPESYGWSGKRAFMINQAGDILAAQNADGAWSGERGPKPGMSGFVEPVPTARVSANAEDCLGETWNVV